MMATNYAAEGNAELDEVCAFAPGYARRFDALTCEQRYNIALAIEAEAVNFLNEQHTGKPTTFPSLNDAMEAAAEGQLVEEESN